MENLPAEYRHEPPMALAGGEDGMDIIRRLLRDAPDFMAPEGILVLEIGHEYDHFAAAFPELDPILPSTENTADQILLLPRERSAEGRVGTEWVSTCSSRWQAATGKKNNRTHPNHNPPT